MISIRECIEPLELNKLLNLHKTFVGAEVYKRIDFYINLFETLEFLQTHERTQGRTIKRLIKTVYLHHTQYEPFIALITENPNDFSEQKYLKLKSRVYFRPEMRNFTVLSGLLKELRRRAENIITLDLNQGDSRKSRYYSRIRVKFSPLGILLKKIFDYDWFLGQTPDGVWGAYQLTKGLGMKVCAYCNRQYTFTLSKGTRKITKPELDHFLPQHQNPLLRVSFFNLIPSCTICNRDCKGQKHFNYSQYLSPYEDNPGHKLFSYDYIPTSYYGAVGENEDIRLFVKSAGVALSPRLLTKVTGNMGVFHHNMIANEHRDVVQEIIRKRVLSNDTYLQIVIDMFPAAALTIEEAYRMAYGNFYHEKEFSKRALAKLTKDIAIDVGVLEKIY
ncbi:hypothetical protein ASE74_01125 [Pedobacter sp. Leaf216]|uniref:hypothetical protein n=1 Tax=Pedobacter sp. Leaf216 TaxID=1735684 RepID=UPI0006FD41AB|nr:hypothetical protein [Pedobacter sp. Leaf216]KQM79201.1 hypothetical protein ASE74_01125 [Pedobacter sp. Leaf216]